MMSPGSAPADQQAQYNQSTENQSWLQRSTVAQLQTERDNQRGLLEAKQAFLAWAELERSRWWWNRNASAAELDRDIARTRRQIQEYQEQLARIDQELSRRGNNT